MDDGSGDVAGGDDENQIKENSMPSSTKFLLKYYKQTYRTVYQQFEFSWPEDEESKEKKP